MNEWMNERMGILKENADSGGGEWQSSKDLPVRWVL